MTFLSPRLSVRIVDGEVLCKLQLHGSGHSVCVIQCCSPLCPEHPAQSLTWTRLLNEV